MVLNSSRIGRQRPLSRCILTRRMCVLCPKTKGELMRAPIRLLFTACLALAVASCGVPIASDAFFAPGAFFSPDAAGSRGLTFAWNQESDQMMGDPRLQTNPFFEDRIHEAVEWELSLRGMRRVESSPDLFVHHHSTLADHVYVTDVVDDSGVTTSEVFSYEEGTIVVHLADPGSEEDLWVAWAAANVEAALAGPDDMRMWVYAIVEEMFKDWPVLGRTAER